MHFILIRNRFLNLDLVTECYWTEAEAPVGLKPVPRRPRSLRVWFSGGNGEAGHFTDFPEGPDAQSLWEHLIGRAGGSTP